jgi:aldehyde:ferredoxin oxidoreductase
MPEIGIEQSLPCLEGKGKGEVAAKTQNIMALFDSLKLCKYSLFGGLKMTPILAWYNIVTGLPMTMEQFEEQGKDLQSKENAQRSLRDQPQG